MKLQGVKVVDLSSFLPGPHLTMMMADHGAQVIKIEQPGSGDATRSIGQQQNGHTVYFRNTNRGKRSVALDLKAPAGRQALLALLKDADVLLETFRPGVAKRLGLDYQAVRQVAPQIVYCSISAFGQDGPMRDQPAHDLSVLALSGALSLTGDTERGPLLPSIPAADMASSLMALSGILMALLRAKQTGQGDYLDISMHDALVSWMAHLTGALFAENELPAPANERLLGGAALYGIYRTADGRFLTLGGSEIKFAENLLTALQRPDLIDAARRPAGAAQLPVRRFLEATFASQPLAWWIEWFKGKDVCWAPVLDLREGLDHAQVQARGMRLKDAEGSDHLGVPIRFANEPARPDFALPALGADGPALLRAAGLSEEQIARLRADKVLAAPE
ncbi:MAG: CaiB/BaiF CoA transferase family protein [Reyranellaceae bacterium]